jgi:signal peptidase II
MRIRVMLRTLYVAVAVFVILVDQATKQWAASTLRGRPDLVLVDNLLRFSYAENPGIAFSLFNSGAASTRWVLALVSTLAAIAVTTFAARTSPKAHFLQSTLALLLGGIVGNLIDRVQTGRVIDFILVHWHEYAWPTFNVADSAISVGAAFLAVELLKNERAPAPGGDTADAR